MFACLLAAASGCQFELELVHRDGGVVQQDGAINADDGGAPEIDAALPAVNPCAGTVTARFDFAATSPADWDFFAYGEATSSLADGWLKVEYDSGDNGDSGGGIFEYNTHDITDGSVITRVQPPSDLIGRFAGINVRQAEVEDPANLELELNGGQVIVFHDGDLVFVTSYQPPEGIYLRIAHAGDSDFDFDSSEDGTSWTTWHTVSDPTLDLDLRASLASGSYMVDNEPATTYYDELIWCQM